MEAETVKLTTGRLYWKPRGETSWIDFGNCQSYKAEPELTRIEHKVAKAGRKHVEAAVLGKVKTRYSFVFDEQFAEAELQLLHGAGTAGSALVSAGASEPALIAQPVAGGSYFLGWVGVTIDSAEDESATPLVEGTHYALSAGAGVISVLTVPHPMENWIL